MRFRRLVSRRIVMPFRRKRVHGEVLHPVRHHSLVVFYQIHHSVLSTLSQGAHGHCTLFPPPIPSLFSCCRTCAPSWQLGKVITSIARGRKDVLAALKRTRYKEMRRAALEKKNPAKATGLPLSFHVRDLLGLGMIRELDTPSGMFLRLPSDPS